MLLKVFLVVSLITFPLLAKWDCLSKIDKMENKRIEVCSTKGTSDRKDWRGNDRLFLRFSGDIFEVYIETGKYVGTTDRIDVKFDNMEKETLATSISTDKQALFIQYSDLTIEKFLSAKNMMIRYSSYLESDITTSFDITSIQNKQIVLKMKEMVTEAKKRKLFDDKVIVLSNDNNLSNETCVSIGGHWNIDRTGWKDKYYCEYK